MSSCTAPRAWAQASEVGQCAAFEFRRVVVPAWWSQGMESNHRYTVLQTAALTTWLPWVSRSPLAFDRGNA
jgi:hypothetical protein